MADPVTDGTAKAEGQPRRHSVAEAVINVLVGYGQHDKYRDFDRQFHHTVDDHHGNR